MTTPPVPQWAVDAIDDVKKHVPVPVEYRYFLARIIAAHAPQGNEDGAHSLSVYKAKYVAAMKELDTVADDLARMEFIRTCCVVVLPDGTEAEDMAALDAARQKDL